MSRDVLTVGSTMRIPLLYRGEYSQWVERFMNYLEEQMDGEAMINLIKNGDQPLPRVTQVSIAGTTSTEQPPLKDKSMWSDQEKRVQKIDRLARSLLIQRLPNDIYSLIDRDVNDAMGSKKKTVVVTFDPLALIAEKTKVSKSKEKVFVSSDSEGSKVDDFNELKKITALLAKAFNRRKFYSKPTNNNLRTSSSSQSANKKQEFIKTGDKKEDKKADEKKRDMSRVKCYNCKKKDILPNSARKQSDLKKITTLAKAFNRKKYYAKPTNNNLRTSSASSLANKKPEYVKSVEKKEVKKADEKKRDTSKVKCYNCMKEGHFAKDCKKAKVKDYNYYKTKMLLAKKDSDEQVLLAEDQAWMECSSDYDQEINVNMVFMAQIEKVLSDSNESSSSTEGSIAEVAYYTSEFESESEYETSEYYDNSTNYGLFVNDNDDQEIFYDAIESASENFIENHIDSQKDYDKSEVDHNDFEEKEHLIDKLIWKFNHKIDKYQKHIEKANQQSKDLENQNKD
nr:hypothetical protein [Tanacetum cinerariifolium]